MPNAPSPRHSRPVSPHTTQNTQMRVEDPARKDLDTTLRSAHQPASSSQGPPAFLFSAGNGLYAASLSSFQPARGVVALAGRPALLVDWLHRTTARAEQPASLAAFHAAQKKGWCVVFGPVGSRRDWTASERADPARSERLRLCA